MRRKKIVLSPLLLLAIGLFFSLILATILRPLLFRQAQIAVINSGPQRYTDPIFNSVNVTKDTSYGASSMDIYEPVGDTSPSRAAIIWIHGGGFGGGDKGLFSDTGNGFASMYAKLGYVGFAINYRLDSRVHTWADAGMKTALNRAVTDTQTAIKYILAHPEYRIDPNQIILAGTSAGAVTALYAGYSTPPAPIAAVVSMAGAMLPSDYNLITPNSPPTIILHGERDKTVPYSAAQQLDAELTRIGTLHEFHPFPNVAHGVAGEPSIHGFIRPFLASHLPLPIPSPSSPTSTCRPRPNCDANNQNCDYTIAIKLDGSINWCPLPSAPSSPRPSCLPLPACVNDHPPCDLANANWCPRPSPIPSTSPSTLQLTGFFNIVYGDSQNGQSSTSYTLTTLMRANTNTPTSYYLNFPVSLGNLVPFNGKMVSLTGNLISINPPTLSVTQIALTSPIPSSSPQLIVSSPVPPTLSSSPSPTPSPTIVTIYRPSSPSPTPRPTRTPTPPPMVEEVYPSNLPQIVAEWTPTPTPSYVPSAKPSFWQRLWQSLRNIFSR